jgi:hypothetical protein
VASASTVLEKATEHVGCHPTEGVKVWRALIEDRKCALTTVRNGLDGGVTDSADDSDSDSSQQSALKDAIQGVRSAYRRCLQAPVAGIDELLTEYLVFEAAEGLGGPSPISQAALDATSKHVLSSKAKLAHRTRFEEDIARLNQTAGESTNVDELVHAWKEYIGSCKLVGGKKEKLTGVLFDYKFVWQLYHRAVADCRDDAGLWTMFFEFAAEVGGKDWYSQYQLEVLAIRRGVWQARPFLQSILHATALHMNPQVAAGCATYAGSGDVLFSPPIISAFRCQDHHQILDRLVSADGSLQAPMCSRSFASQSVDSNLASLYVFVTQSVPAGSDKDPVVLLKQILGLFPNVAVLLHGLSLVSRHATDAVSIPLADASTYVTVLKAAIGSFCRLLQLVYTCTTTGTIEGTTQSAVKELCVSIARSFVAHFLQVFLHYYPGWDEGRYLLQSHFAKVAFEILGNTSLCEEVFDECLIYRGTDAPLAQLAACDFSKHVIIDPVRLFNAYQDAVTCARCQLRYARCADLYHQMLHRFSTARLHAHDMSPTPFDMVSAIVDAWEDFAVATGCIDEAIEAIARGSVRKADVLRRQARSLAMHAHGSDNKNDAHVHKRKRESEAEAVAVPDLRERAHKPAAKRPRCSSEAGNDNVTATSGRSCDATPSASERTSMQQLTAESDFPVSFRRPKSSAPLKPEPEEAFAVSPAKPAHDDDPLEPNTIYVWNLPFSDAVSRPTLQAEFGRFGKIVDSKAILGAGRVCKGFGWVKFDDASSMQNAILANQSVVIGGRPVGIAQAKHSQVYPAFLFRAKPVSTAEPSPLGTGSATSGLAAPPTVDDSAPPPKRVSALSFVPRASLVKKPPPASNGPPA